MREEYFGTSFSFFARIVPQYLAQFLLAVVTQVVLHVVGILAVGILYDAFRIVLGTMGQTAGMEELMGNHFPQIFATL